MTQARELNKKAVETSESGNVQVLQPEESHWQHSFLQLQRRAGNNAVVNLLATQGLVQRKCSTCTASTKCASCEEEEEERMVQRKEKNLSSTAPRIQRAPDAATTEPAPTEAVGPLIVEDDAASVGPGQMRKSEFLEQLRSTVCSTADEALKEVGQSTEGCPYIEQWLGYYAEQTPAHIERALRKFAPDANSATSAHDYIPAVSNRVRQAVQTWSQTGEVPEELAGMMSGGMLGGIGGLLGGIGSAIGGAISAIGSAVGSAFSALFKAKEGQEASADDPQGIQSQLSAGQPLNATVGSQMGEAFGHDFSQVRVHTDASATGLSEQMNARAFTVGSDIAFAVGEYQPGTLIGDALIAHELAHVVQQHGGAAAGSLAPQHKNDGDTHSLEEEADVAAVGAVVSTWSGRSALTDIGTNAMPRLRSGLRLQSCSKTPQITVPRGQWITPEQSDKLLADDKLIWPRIKDRVAKGTKAVGHTNELDTLDFLGKATDIEGEDAKIEKTSREMIRTGGFMYGGEIYLHKPSQDAEYSVTRNGKTETIFAPPSAQPSTIVHETIHLYGTEEWREKAGHWADEGTTEYFTRRILSKQKNEEGGGAGMFERISYPEEFEAVKCLADKGNDELLADAYFLGKVEPLRKDVGAAKFDAWTAAMKEKDYPKAFVALGCKPPEKKADE
ncbi:MAG TPA: DUF4157 domain-containing protein [Pyrinomonadaceae bacterium]|nr:DUF4157 domain-containing protein [Pyrinomonadaceae bacterium]